MALKRIMAYTLLTVLAALSFSFLINASKAGVIGVGTYDANTGLPRDTFSAGESVRIIAQSSVSPLTIRIIDPDSVETYSETVSSLTFDKILSGITQKSGWYTVEASSQLTTNRVSFATVFFNSVPEAPLGTASIAAVSLAALGVYGVIRRKK